MIRLDTYQRKLQAVLGGAVTTSQPTVVVCYTDIENENQKKFFVESVTSVLNNTTAVDILPAPDKAMVRQVDFIHLRNADTVAATVTVRIDDNGTAYELVEVTLQAGETLIYTDSEGWKVFTQYGNTASVFNYIDFNLNAPAPGAEGRLYWDSGDGSLTLGLKGGNTALQLGQENVALAYNDSGVTITAGSVVAVSGAQGQRPKIVLADADTEPLSAATLGIAAESISNGAEGFVCTFGLVRGIDTSTFTAGNPIYLSQTAGKFTATRPPAPAHTVFLGWVIKVNASSGEVFVHISNGWELDELHNVLISSPLDGQVLTYEQSTSLWKNVTPAAGVSSFSAGTTGFTPSVATTGAVTLAGTLDVDNGGTGQSSYTIGDILYASGATALSKLADIATGNALISGGVGVAPSWGKIGLTTHITGTLAVGNGGIGITSGTSGGIPYFSSTSAITSSAVLASSAIVVGGGAGSAPSTITTGTGVVTALGVNTGTAGAFVVNGGALGTPTSGTVTNLTGTASININGTVGATTPTTGAFTTLSASSTVSGTGFSTYLASPPAIGGTAAAAGSFTTLSASNVATFSAGTAAAPAITTTGDTNTGEFFPAADTIAWTTNGAEKMRLDTNGNLTIGGTAAYSSFASLELTKATGSRLAFFADSASATGINSLTANATGFRTLDLTATDFNFKNGTSTFVTINSSGNVGIGTSSPSTRLHVRGAITLDNNAFPTGNYGDILSNTSSTLDYGLLFSHYNNSTKDTFMQMGGNSTTGNVGVIVFGTNTAGNAATERLRIDSSGNVGIGTSSPGAKLDVNGNITVGNNTNIAHTIKQNNDTAVLIYSDAANQVTLESARASNSATKYDFYFNKYGGNSFFGGNVGIGTSSPGYKLDVNGVIRSYGTDFAQIWLRATNAGGVDWRWLSGSTSGTSGNILLENVTGSVQAIAVTPSGNVGIGTSSPTSIAGFTSVTVNNATTGGLIDVQCNGTTVSRLYANSNIAYLYNQSSNPLVFGTGGTEKMRIDSSGNVGIGTTNTNYSKVNVSGSIGLTSPINFMDSTLNTTRYGYINHAGSAGNMEINNQQNAAIFFSTNNTERLRIDSSGNVGIGVTPSYKLHVEGGGTALVSRFQGTNSPYISILDSDNSVEALVAADGAGYTIFGSITNHAAVFRTNNTERMRIDSSGNVGIGVTPSHRLHVKITTADTTGYFESSGSTKTLQVYDTGVNGANILLTGDGAVTPKKYIRSWGGELQVGNDAYTAVIWKTTDAGATYNSTGTFGTISDLRVKENIQDSRNYLEDLCKLRVIKYSLKSEQSEVPTKLGLIAQEVEEVFPGLVEESKDDMQGIDDLKQIKMSILVPMLLKSVQELKFEVDFLKTELAKKES